MQPWFRRSLDPLYAAAPLFTSRDLGEVRWRTAAALKEHELNWRSGRVDSSLCTLAVGDASLMLLRYGAAVTVVPGALQDFLLFQVPVWGAASIAVGGTRLRTDACTAALISPTLSLQLQWEEGCEQLLVKFPRERVERLCGWLLGMPITAPIEFQPCFAMDTDVGCCWQHQLGALLSWCRNPPVGPSGRWVDAQQEALIQYLLLSQPHNYSALLEQGPRGASRNLRRAAEYIAAHLQEPLVLARIARAGGVSVRSLCAGFREHFGQSPMAYVRSQRMDHARSELMRAAPGTHVTEVALRWGFTHLGRFCARYRRRYGETPAETLRK